MPTDSPLPGNLAPSSQRPFHSFAPTTEIEDLAAPLPADFPWVEALRDGEQLLYLMMLRRLFDEAGIRPRGVVHVGANVGEELAAYLFLGFTKILLIEANPAAIPALSRNIDAFNALAARCDRITGTVPPARAESIHCAVGAEPGTATLYVTDVPTLSSLLLPNTAELTQDASWFEVRKQTPVVMRPLDDIAASLPSGWQPADFNFLRLNIQGAELIALQGATKWLQHFQLVFSEINLVKRYDGCPQLADIDEKLAASGFTRPFSYQWDKTGGDAAYLRG